MDISTIKDLMNKRLITEVIDVAELVKLSDDDIRANYITHVVDFPEFSNDDVKTPTETPVDEPLTDHDDNGASVEGESNNEDPGETPVDEPLTDHDDNDAPVEDESNNEDPGETPADEPSTDPVEDDDAPIVDEGEI